MGVKEQLDGQKALSSSVLVPRRVGYMGGQFEVDIQADYFDPSKCEPEDIARECSRASHNSLAAKICSGSEMPPDEGLVYVIAERDGDHCKIGVATDPIKRLRGIQTGNPRPLAIFSLFWMVASDPYRLELTSHNVARELGVMACGEWVKCPAAEAAMIVAAVAHSDEFVKVASSALWMKQRSRLDRKAFDIQENAGWMEPDVRRIVQAQEAA
jgi:hypothetical protein